MKSKNRADSDLAFTRAAEDEKRDSEYLWLVSWRMELLDTEQRGVYCLIITVRNLEDRPTAKPVVTYAANWPNSTAISFAAFLYQCSHKTYNMVQEWAQSQGRKPAGEV